MQETYLYHISRKDHRHNFSLYFYPLYLSHFEGNTPSFFSLFGAAGSFIPQFGIVLVLGALLAKRDIFLACFAQTFTFVMMNKVVTSQYFMWYLFFLPLILPNNRLIQDRWKLGVFLIVCWIASQAFWLFFAYSLEHLGENTFRELWVGSLFFFVSNSLILGYIIQSQK